MHGTRPSEYDPVAHVEHELKREAQRKPEKYGRTDWVLPGIIYIVFAVLLILGLLTLGGPQRMPISTLMAGFMAIVWIFGGFPLSVAACVIIGAGNGPGGRRFLMILGVVGYLVVYLIISIAFMETHSLPIG